jgi:hypothetical protein
MAIKSLPLLLAALVCCGCGTTTSSPRAAAKDNSGRPEELSLRQEFDRKVQCEKYASQIRAEWKDERRDENAKLNFQSQILLPTIERLFYSAQRNSCVCVARQHVTGKAGDPLNDHIFIFDVLTKELIWGKDYWSADQVANVQKDIAEQVQHLSGPPK